jgi:hypothetical protein
VTLRGAWEHFRRTYDRYRKATRRKRSELLSEFGAVVELNRKYATRLLNWPHLY